MKLTGKELLRNVRRGEIGIEPFREDRLRGDDYPLHLAPQAIRVLDRIIDPRRPLNGRPLLIPPDGLMLSPGDFLLARTVEAISSEWWVPIVQPCRKAIRHPALGFLAADIVDDREPRPCLIPLVVARRVRIVPRREIATVSFWRPLEGRGRPSATARPGMQPINHGGVYGSG